MSNLVRIHPGVKRQREKTETIIDKRSWKKSDGTWENGRRNKEDVRFRGEVVSVAYKHRGISTNKRGERHRREPHMCVGDKTKTTCDVIQQNQKAWLSITI